ncbi:MAG: hypothetical protein ACYC0X_15625 [Pirellulaceae bacterium]
MDKQSNDLPEDAMAAEPEDPGLSVHGLSEFVFCSRAGLCLHEQEREEDDSEEEPNLYFLPIHEPRELALVLQSLLRQFLWVLFGGLSVFALMVVIAWLSGWPAMWLVAALCLALIAWGLYDRGYWLYQAQRELELWQEATPVLPDAESIRIQEIDWRNLLASEVTVIRPPAAYHDADWRLGGKPWRVLEHGDLRIPVFKPRRPWKDLFPQHFVRMAAYCRLLEINEGARSPYGVIVKGETYAAITVPNTARSQALFRQALWAARGIVRESEEVNRRPSPPEDLGICRECPFGRPVPLRPGARYLRRGAPITPKVLKDPRNRKYHSHCGDRFGWMAPHGLVEAMQLSVEHGPFQ